MAKRIKSYKGFTIKQTTARDKTNYAYWIVKGGITEWEADSIEECESWIDCY